MAQVAPASAPILVPSAYPANAAVLGYNTNASNNALPVAGLLVDVVSAVAEHMLASGMYETDPAVDERDRGFGNDDATR
jgi:hypothetical protein